jgi:RND family efflux transporter MFP subunit
LTRAIMPRAFAIFRRFIPLRRARAAIVLTLAPAAAAACSPGDASSNAGGGAAARPAVAVGVTPVTRRTLARHVTLTAPVEPIRRIGVNSQMTGTVLRVLVQEGDRLAAGALMAELDTREVVAQLERARATLTNAEAAFRRATEMHERQIITEAEYEQASAAFGTARSDVALWETRLGFGRIRAPAPGVVTAKVVEAGSAVTPNQRMFELADESLLVTRVQVSELDVVHLTGGERVSVLLDAYPDAPVPGRIRRIFPGADPQSRLVPVEIALGTPPAGVVVRPGFLARVRLDLDAIEAAMVVPNAALGESAEGAFVFTVEADTIVRRPVRIGLTAEGWLQIVSGLTEGERVVTSGHTNLRSGVRVRVASAGTNDTAGGTP